MIYEVIKNYEITYKTEKMISLYTDKYIFSGGAHGNTIRKSQNWDISKAMQIPLNEIYSNNPNYVLEILKQINKQIQERLKENPSTYFNNYCQLVIETINLENYYRIPNKIVIFFQQYDIAPYSTGIPTFEIKI